MFRLESPTEEEMAELMECTDSDSEAGGTEACGTEAGGTSTESWLQEGSEAVGMSTGY